MNMIENNFKHSVMLCSTTKMLYFYFYSEKKSKTVHSIFKVVIYNYIYI